MKLWHNRRRHIGNAPIDAMMRNLGYVIDMTGTGESTKDPYEIRTRAKRPKSPATGNLVNSEDIITVHTDICGPFCTQ